MHEEMLFCCGHDGRGVRVSGRSYDGASDVVR